MSSMCFGFIAVQRYAFFLNGQNNMFIFILDFFVSLQKIMKTIFFYFWLFLALGLTTVILYSCSKDKSVTDISLDKSTLTLAINKDYTLTATVTPDNATEKVVMWSSDNETVATVVNGKVTAIAEGKAKITAKAGNHTAICIVTVNNDIVENDSLSDTGIIINGIKWATRNVDAPGTFAAKPENTGMFYQYSRNVGWSTTDPLINSNGGTTWNSIIPTTDFWDRANDPSPTGWRAPTYEEIETLFETDEVDYEWTTENEVRGGRFTDRTSGNSIFLPAAGYRSDVAGSLTLVGTWGIYWSATTRCGCTNARFMRFESSQLTWSTLNRRNGFSLRSVAE